MESNNRTTGTECIGSVPWGTHFCEFHSTREELADTLVPYFAAGLQQDEFCLWVTSDPSGVEGAEIGLRKAAPDLDRYLDMGQIEIWDCRDWYLRGGHFDADRVFGQWVEKEKRSLDTGYKGLRVTADMAWLEKGDWPDFMAYEAEVNRVLPQHRMIGLCTYPLDGCPADAVKEVVRNHQFAPGRIAGERDLIERSSLKAAKEELRQRNGDLQGQTEQTAHLDTAKVTLNERLRMKTSVSEQLRRFSAHVLEQQDEERRRIGAELHEVTAQNVSAIAIYLASLQRRSSWPSEVKSILAKCHALCDHSLEQILTLAHRLHPPILDTLGLAACLRQYIQDFMQQNHIHVEFETGPEIGRLPLEMETHLFRVAQEGLSNILRHSGSLNAMVRLERQADEVILEIEDFGRGMSATAAAASGGARMVGLGILGVQERLRKIGGRLEVRSSHQGTMLTASVRHS
jgi:two-component system, sensor histidine kinase PdtaS